MTRDAVDGLARELSRRGLVLPARVLLEAHRPIAPLLTDLVTAAAPLLGAWGWPPAVSMGRVLADRDGINQLLDALDRQDAAGEACPAPES